MVLALLLLLNLAVVADQARAAEVAALPVLATRLPLQPFECQLTEEKTRPIVALRGRPGVLLFLDADDGTPSDLELFLGKMQQQFAPWLQWGAVLAGGADARKQALGRLGGAGPLRVDHCWGDPDGAWRSSFGITGLPSAVLVSDTGFVTALQGGLRPEEETKLLRSFERLVGSGLVAARPARDFKLEESVSGKPVTFADLPRRDYTLLLSVKSECQSCVEELHVLRAASQRHPGRVALVMIDHDDSPHAADRPTPAGPAECDLSLRDSGQLYAERYALGGVPTLVVVDRRGMIILARAGFLPQDADELSRDLEALLGRQDSPGEAEGRFAEFLRVRSEALELLESGRAGLAAFFLERAVELFPDFYTVLLPLAQAYLAAGQPQEAARSYERYLAAEPRAPDRGAVIARLRTIGAAP